MGLLVMRRNNPIVHFELRLISDAPGDKICGFGDSISIVFKGRHRSTDDRGVAQAFSPRGI